MLLEYLKGGFGSKTYRRSAVIGFSYPNSKGFGRGSLLLNVERRCSKIGSKSVPDPKSPFNRPPMANLSIYAKTKSPA